MWVRFPHTYISSRNVRITPGVGQARLYPTEWDLQMGTAPTPSRTEASSNRADAFELGQFARGRGDLNTSACV